MSESWKGQWLINRIISHLCCLHCYQGPVEKCVSYHHWIYIAVMVKGMIKGFSKNVLISQHGNGTTTRSSYDCHHHHYQKLGAGIAKSLMCWDCCPAWYSIMRLILLWASSRACFPLGANMDSNSITLQLFQMRVYKPRSSLCTHAFYRKDSKDPYIHVLDRWMPATKTPSMHHPPRTEYDYLNGWTIKLVTYAKISPKMVNSTDIAGNTEEEEEAEILVSCTAVPHAEVQGSYKAIVTVWPVITIIIIITVSIAVARRALQDLGPVSWRPTTVKWRQSQQSNRSSTIGTRQTENHEALPSSANDKVRCDCTSADNGSASWYSVCRVPMVEWRLDCEKCRHLTVVGLHDASPWSPACSTENSSSQAG